MQIGAIFASRSLQFIWRNNRETAVLEKHLKSLLTCDKGSNTCRVRSDDLSKTAQPVGGKARPRKYVFE